MPNSCRSLRGIPVDDSIRGDPSPPNCLQMIGVGKTHREETDFRCVETTDDEQAITA